MSTIPQEYHRHDAEMAGLSGVVYNLPPDLAQQNTPKDPDSPTTIDNWDRLETHTDSETGFKAAIFQRRDSNDYVLAFAGSDMELNDWLTNGSQALGYIPKQYEQAADLAKQFQEKYGSNDHNLVITGHSLGGGEAILGSAVTGLPAVIFNPAGVHDNTLETLTEFTPEQFRQQAEAGLIRNYVVEGELLDLLNGRSPKEIVSLVGDSIRDRLDDALEDAPEAVKNAVKPMGQIAGNTINETVRTVANTGKAVAETTANAVIGSAHITAKGIEVMAHTATGVIASHTDVAGYVAEKFANGVARGTAIGNSVGNTLSNTADTIRHTAENAMDNQPRPVAATIQTIAVATTQPLASTLDAVAGVTKVATNVTGTLLSGTANGIQFVAGETSGAIRNAANTVTHAANTAADTVENAVNGMTNGARNLVNKASAWWRTPTPGSYGQRYELNAAPGTGAGDRHRIGSVREAMDAAASTDGSPARTDHSPAAKAAAFRRDPAEAARTYPELASARESLEAVRERAPERVKTRAVALTQKELARRIEHDVPIPPPAQMVKMAGQAVRNSLDRGR